MIQRYQRAEPSIIAKYKNGTYHKGYFHGGSNINLNLITYEDKIVIPEKIQSYVLNWYHTYLLHPGVDRTEVSLAVKAYWTALSACMISDVESIHIVGW